MHNSIGRILQICTAACLFFGISGCGINDYFLSKQDLVQVNDRLSVIERQLEEESVQTERLLEQVSTQEKMLQELRTQGELAQQAEREVAVSYKSLHDQILLHHEQTKRGIALLRRSLVTDQPQDPDLAYRHTVSHPEDTEKMLIGRLEKVRVSPPGQVFHARIDTGATTSSLDARNIGVFERDGSTWVHFQIQDPENKDAYYDVERPIVRWVKIIQAASEESDRRPVVNLQFQIGRIERMEEFTLEDRSHMDYQVLIGRNVLRDLMVVDVAHTFLVPLPAEKSDGINHK
jgi:hypothetical protein